MRKCPHCKKNVSDTARKCKFCWERIIDNQDYTVSNEKSKNYDGDIGRMLVKYVGWFIILWVIWFIILIIILI